MTATDRAHPRGWRPPTPERTVGAVEVLGLPCRHVVRRERVKAALREGGSGGWSTPVACGFDGCGRVFEFARSADGWSCAEVTERGAR